MGDQDPSGTGAHPPAQPTRPTSPTGGTPLTAEGRRVLEERARQLRLTVADLGQELDDTERSSDVVDGYQRATTELTRLESLLARAEILDDLPDNPLRVELGDRVTIRLDDGTEESYRIVHAEEAVVADERISVDSPLGQALLARDVGETVEVAVPGSSYSCTILNATRRDHSSETIVDPLASGPGVEDAPPSP